MLLSRISPAARGNLLIAAIPLGIALIAHGMAALEQLVNSRTDHLAELEARITARTSQLAALGDVMPPPVPTFEQPAEPGPDVEDEDAENADDEADSSAPAAV